VPRRIILHIGPRKTGTTFLQRVLHAVAPELRDRGLLYPTAYRKRDDYNQVGAVSSLTYNDEARRGNRRIGRGLSDWRGLQRQVEQFDGDVLLSAEMIAGLRPAAVRKVLNRLRAEETLVVITARDLGRILPSSWQQHIRNGHTEPYGTYLGRRANERGTLPPVEMRGRWDAERHQTFWRAYAYGVLVRRWQELVGPDGVRVVTVPQQGSDPNVLWARFRAALDVPGLPEAAPSLPAHTANQGSTHAEALVLRAVNLEAKQRGWSRHTIKTVHNHILASGLLTRADRGVPLLLPPRYLPTVCDWALADIADLRELGVRVVGDLSDLHVLDSAAGRSEASAREIAGVGAFLAIQTIDLKSGDIAVNRRRKRPASATARPQSQRLMRRVRRRIARLRPES